MSTVTTQETIDTHTLIHSIMDNVVQKKLCVEKGQAIVRILLDMKPESIPTTPNFSREYAENVQSFLDEAITYTSSVNCKVAILDAVVVVSNDGSVPSKEVLNTVKGLYSKVESKDRFKGFDRAGSAYLLNRMVR